MKNTMYRSISLLLALVLVLALVLLPGNDPANTVSASDLPVGEGITLHCWNWSYKSIEENLPLIAGMGYTSIQTSPIQQAKQATAGYQYYDWWVYYQPASFSIDNTGNSALGTKAEFESMCRKAHSYGIKVIVDIVANHMGNQSGNDLAPSIIPDLRNDPSCWHDISRNTNDYSKRYDVTQWCMAGLPDLNTANKKVQNYVLSFMKECIDAGVDGFRFDAAKHIETPDDGGDNCASDFWPTIINGATSYASSTRGIDLYCYGEVLDSLGGSLSMTSYTKYMSVTDNTWSDSVRNQVINGRNAGAFSYLYHKGNDASKLVLWAESHDTYANNASSGTSTGSINKTWALVAARGDAMSLYFARPGSYAQALGTASVTGWANAEVGAVNRFHNHFNGQSEYVANENGIAYV
jgi:alpha-amylase